MISHATQTRIDEVLADPAAHYWLIVTLERALLLDPVDVLNDLDVLRDLMDAVWADILAANPPHPCDEESTCEVAPNDQPCDPATN